MIGSRILRAGNSPPPIAGEPGLALLQCRIMCGFAGKIWLEAGRPADNETVGRMGALVAHRGPDEARMLSSGEAAFAFRRLAIIDVDGGHQPLENEDGRYSLVFNGEIYNYRELMNELEGRGHQFSTRCDAEVVVHLYEERGTECVQALEGMFAFALWDRVERILFMARDRTGKKPLYWAKLADSLVFASELKALPQEHSFDRQLDHRALAEYLTWQYVPAPRTIFKDVCKLEPAHWVRIQLARDGGAPEIRDECYWTLNYQPKARYSRGEAEEQVREHLDRAVARRLESEVPLGILLSGGIDSSSIVAAARRHISGPLKTFSIGFKETGFNELPYARQVAELYETEHTDSYVRPKAVKLLPELVWHADEPFGDSSALPTFVLSQMTKAHVTVALGGEGGDESFAGYTRYQTHPLLRAARKLPVGVRKRMLRPLIQSLSRMRPRNLRLIKLQHLLDHSLGSPDELYPIWLMIFSPVLMSRIWAGSRDTLSPPISDWALESLRRTDATHLIDKKMACDISTYLPGDLLLKIDRMSMAHGLEVRCPFLDRELMEFAARLPAELKTPRNELKGLLKSSVRDWLPKELLNRPKQGFGVPLARWFREDLKDLPGSILLSERARARGLFNEKGVRTMIEQHHRGHADLSHRLWTLMAFETWAQTFLDPPVAPTAPLSSIEM